MNILSALARVSLAATLGGVILVLRGDLSGYGLLLVGMVGIGTVVGFARPRHRRSSDTGGDDAGR